MKARKVEVREGRHGGMECREERGMEEESVALEKTTDLIVGERSGTCIRGVGSCMFLLHKRVVTLWS